MYWSASAGFAEARVEAAEAFYEERLGEFLLPYDAVRTSRDPEKTLMAFLDSTYGAAADLGEWNRRALECPIGKPRHPRALLRGE